MQVNGLIGTYPELSNRFMVILKGCLSLRGLSHKKSRVVTSWTSGLGDPMTVIGDTVSRCLNLLLQQNIHKRQLALCHIHAQRSQTFRFVCG